jgi:hypothetical protein
MASLSSFTIMRFSSDPKVPYSRDDSAYTDSYSYGSSIEKLEKERDDYYKKRNSENYGSEVYSSPKQEPYQTSEDINSIVKEYKSNLGEDNTSSYDYKAKEQKIDDQESSSARWAYRVFTWTSFGLIYSLFDYWQNYYSSYLQLKKTLASIKNDKRVEKLVDKANYGTVSPLRLVLKKGNKMTYEELEDIVFQNLKPPPENFKAYNGRYTCVIGGT